ncbi:hypothetical protein Bhyg_04507 [Pseudolycoriella hygida]|uniref:Uncharacterized protein n=1 Tax=Pseudolycoriella hygida TaxID=35572 RepID=A0A9Q0NFN6_9DIPT|nr:hypothetical protein Bhyg_04507 [Pseudolycoriella hygida]
MMKTFCETFHLAIASTFLIMAGREILSDSGEEEESSVQSTTTIHFLNEASESGSYNSPYQCNIASSLQSNGENASNAASQSAFQAPQTSIFHTKNIATFDVEKVTQRPEIDVGHNKNPLQSELLPAEEVPSPEYELLSPPPVTTMPVESEASNTQYRRIQGGKIRNVKHLPGQRDRKFSQADAKMRKMASLVLARKQEESTEEDTSHQETGSNYDEINHSNEPMEGVNPMPVNFVEIPNNLSLLELWTAKEISKFETKIPSLPATSLQMHSQTTQQSNKRSESIHMSPPLQNVQKIVKMPPPQMPSTSMTEGTQQCRQLNRSTDPAPSCEEKLLRSENVGNPAVKELLPKGGKSILETQITMHPANLEAAQQSNIREQNERALSPLPRLLGPSDSSVLTHGFPIQQTPFFETQISLQPATSVPSNSQAPFLLATKPPHPQMRSNPVRTPQSLQGSPSGNVCGLSSNPALTQVLPFLEKPFFESRTSLQPATSEPTNSQTTQRSLAGKRQNVQMPPSLQGAQTTLTPLPQIRSYSVPVRTQDQQSSRSTVQNPPSKADQSRSGNASNSENVVFPSKVFKVPQVPKSVSETAVIRQSQINSRGKSATAKSLKRPNTGALHSKARVKMIKTEHFPTPFGRHCVIDGVDKLARRSVTHQSCSGGSMCVGLSHEILDMLKRNNVTISRVTKRERVKVILPLKKR